MAGIWLQSTDGDLVRSAAGGNGRMTMRGKNVDGVGVALPCINMSHTGMSGFDP